MIVKLEQDLSQEDIEVLIRYRQLNGVVKKLVSLVNSAQYTIRCTEAGRELWLNSADIFYIESVDKKTFVYSEQQVYRTELRLYQLLGELKSSGFVQISKSCLLNINQLEGVKTLLNSRLEAPLKNGERVNVTRKYLPQIRESLQGGGPR